MINGGRMEVSESKNRDLLQEDFSSHIIQCSEVVDDSHCIFYAF